MKWKKNRCFRNTGSYTERSRHLNRYEEKQKARIASDMPRRLIISGTTRVFFLPPYGSFEFFHGRKFARKLRFFDFYFIFFEYCLNLNWIFSEDY